jgi:hypothetical protein
MKNQILMLLSFCTILLSCASENKGIKASDLEGTWVCKKAIDNGDSTDLILGAEITFKGSKLNFPILESINKAKEQDFNIKNDELICQNDKDLIFKIKALKDEKMTLQFSMEGHDLSLEMEKTK